MSNRKFLAVLSVVFLLGVEGARGQSSAPAKNSTPAAASSNIVVPARTTIPLELKNTISSRTAQPGQAIYCQTIYPITVGNRMVIPAGTYVKGSVTQVIRPGRAMKRAQLGLRFTEITLPNGTTRPLRATLSGFAGNGKQGFKPEESKIEGESSKGEDAGKVASTTITGAELGTIVGAAKRSPGTGLGVGSAVGAAGGLIWVLASHGKDILLMPGTSLELELTSPLTFSRDEIDEPATDRYREGPALPRRDPGPGI